MPGDLSPPAVEVFESPTRFVSRGLRLCKRALLMRQAEKCYLAQGDKREVHPAGGGVVNRTLVNTI